MHIKDNGDYENASMILITHEDKEYSNSVFKLVCSKSRKKMNDGSFGMWGDLHFRFEITNKDMTYGSNGNYRSVTMSRSDFLSWMLSLQQAVNNPDVYKNEITVKRRFKKNDLIIKFAVSEKLNCNAILMCILTSQSVYSKIGINGLLFNQFLLQLGKMAVDILNFELNFDNSILLYKNNQNVEYQSSQMELQSQQNAKIIEILSNNITISHDRNIESIDNSNENEDMDDHFETDIDVITATEEEENNILENNNSNFVDQLKDIDNIKLEKLFDMRTTDIENPKEIDTKKVHDETTLIKISKLNERGIEVFSSVFRDAQKKNLIQDAGLTNYFCNILGDPNFYLQDCDEKDVVSLSYLSQIQFSNILTQYNEDESLKDFVDIPLLYKIGNHNHTYEQTRNIYDLIAIYVYMVRYSKSFKVRMPNAIENKEIFTKFFRLIFEPVYMTFLTSDEITFDDNVQKLIFQHYCDLKKIDFFKDWNDKFVELDLSLPSDEDIKLCIIDLKNYVTSIKGMTTEMVHNKFYEKKFVRLPYKNEFNQEHIFEIVKLECYFDGVSVINEQTIKYALDLFKITPSEKTMSYYKKTYMSDKTEIVLDKLIDETSQKKETSLYRFVNKNLSSDEVYKDSLLDFIDKIDNNNLYLKDLPDDISIHSIPENILMALYIWQPKDDFRIKQFSYLIEQVKNCWKTKTDIITDYITEKENHDLENTLEKTTDWGAFV